MRTVEDPKAPDSLLLTVLMGVTLVLFLFLLLNLVGVSCHISCSVVSYLYVSFRVYLIHYAADCMPSFNPILLEGYTALFSCMAVVQDGFDVKL